MIESASFDVSMLDTDTAIEVCKESKQLDCAMLLAKSSNNVDQQLRILIENQKDYKEALGILANEISLDKQPQYFRRFGPQLLRELPKETYEEVEKVADKLIARQNMNQRNRAEVRRDLRLLKEIFVDSDEYTKRLIDFQIGNDPKCEEEVYHSLIEWQLQDYHKSKKNNEAKEIIEKKKDMLMNTLKSYKDCYDKKHVLMLLEMYQVSEGVGLLCEYLELTNELMTYYMQNKDYDNIISFCKKNEKSDDSLWIQALTYFVEQSANELEGSQSQKYLEVVLEHLKKVSSISPLMVLEIVSRNKSVKFSVLKGYLSERLNALHTTIDKNRTKLSQFNKEIEKTKQSITNLRTTAQLFQLKECADCGKKLELPIYHFMCNHSYHEYCIMADTTRECPKCCIQAQQVVEKKDQLVKQIDNQEQFFKELKDGSKKFNVIARYFGRGLFSDMNKREKHSEERKD